MPVRGIRGAITVEENTKQEILAATKQLLSSMLQENEVQIEEIASVIFSVTKDLNAEFPAAAAREMGWNNLPLLCTYEIDIPGSLPKCIRILIHLNTEKSQSQIKHIYLKEATTLRRD